MRNALVALMCVIMIAYVIYRGFTTFFILPFTVPLFSPSGIYSLLLVLIAAAATVLGLTQHKGIAVLLAGVVGLAALGSWLRLSSKT